MGFEEMLSSLGQHQLLRRRLHRTLRLHCMLSSPLATEAMGALNDSALADALGGDGDGERGEDNSQLPNLDDFLGDGSGGGKAGGMSAEDMLLHVQRRTAQAGELAGISQPFFQV